MPTKIRLRPAAIDILRDRQHPRRTAVLTALAYRLGLIKTRHPSALRDKIHNKLIDWLDQNQPHWRA